MKKAVFHPAFSSRNCTACWRCVDVCPARAIRKVGFLWHKHAKPFYLHCIGCNRCVNTCPQGCFIAHDNRHKDG